MRVYDFIQFLKSVGAWDGVAGSCAYWNTRADYETVYAYILTHEPERKYGYLARTANALSNKRLGGGGSTSSTERTSAISSKRWKKPSWFKRYWRWLVHEDCGSTFFEKMTLFFIKLTITLFAPILLILGMLGVLPD